MRLVLSIDTSKLNGNTMLCLEAGFSMLFDKVALICEKPVSIYRNSTGQLHRDGSQALSYSDGSGVWALNGVRMQPEYIMTPAEDLTPETVLSETNADIRRELLKKVGIERMLSALPHRQLDKRGDYELLSLRLSDQVPDARYLKMLNPSIGVWHMEGAWPDDDTVEKCLNRRNSNWFTNAEVIT